MADEQGEKTEKPSTKKYKEAREKGQVARSRDLGSALTLMAVTAALGALGQHAIARLASSVSDALTALPAKAAHDVTGGDLTTLVLENGALIAWLVGPIALTAAAVSVGVSAAQGGLRFAPAALHFHWERLSPATGFAKLAPSQSWVDTFKTILAVVVLVSIAVPIVRAIVLDGLRYPWMTPAGAAAQGWGAISRLLWQGSIGLLAIGAADYGLQWWRHFSGLKMTKQEVRDEGKSSEGSPEIKGRVRKIQREMVRRRMLKAVAHATVVVTNPTHYAVALEYRREKNPAPIVLAKGRDLVALKIREIARTNGVPIVENPPLARALHAGAEVGETIPAPLFGAVAEVLAYLIRIKQLML
jgi:flagellar biosynthetic protein FlhB